MRRIHGTDEVHLQHSRPIGRLQVPKRKPKLSGTDAHAEHNVIDRLKARREGFHRLIARHIPRGDEIRALFPVESAHGAAFSRKPVRNGPANASGGSKHSNRLTFEIQFHLPL